MKLGQICKAGRKTAKAAYQGGMLPAAMPARLHGLRTAREIQKNCHVGTQPLLLS